MALENQSRSASNVNPILSSSEPLIRAAWLRGILLFIAYFIWSILCGIPIVLVFKVNTEEEILNLMVSPIAIPISACLLGGTLLLVWAFRRGIDRRSLGSLGFSFTSRYRKEMLYGMLWGIAMVSSVFLVLLFAESIVVTGWNFPWQSLLVMLATLFMVALMEEVTFRGYLLNNLLQSVNPILALVLSSVLFLLAHLVNPGVGFVGFVNSMLAGLVLGVYYVHRRNLWFPIGLHLTWNFFQGTIFGSPVSGIEINSVLTLEITGSELVSGGDFGFEASLVSTIVILVATAMVHLVYRRPQETASSSTPQ